MPPNAAFTETVWGDHWRGRVLRGLLTPFEGVYRAAVGGRNALFDLGIRQAREPALPAVSVGNLSMGGTGKTPFASFLAGRLLAMGLRPGLVLRGYGDDEVAVHQLLQPSLAVFATADRVAGSERARADGCEVVIFDDAFQHRQVRRDIDVVLVSADAPWTTRCLPRGPLREPVTAVRRADLVVVTRKAASAELALAIERRVRVLGAQTVVHATLSLDRILGLGPDMPPRAEHDVIAGKSVLAIAGVGDPDAFFGQLEQLGARVFRRPFPDHFPYGAADITSLQRGAESVDYVVCTLKDAVKLRALWPRSGPPLWYVSQRVDLTSGEGAVDDVLRRLMLAKSRTNR